MCRVPSQRFAGPHYPVPPSGSAPASTSCSCAGLTGTRRYLLSASDSPGAGDVLPAGTGTSGCAACSCWYPPSAGGLPGSTDAARLAAVGRWRTGQPVPVLYWPNHEEMPGVGGHTPGPHCGSAGGPWDPGCCLLTSWECRWDTL